MALSTVTTTLKGLAAVTLSSILALGAFSPAFAADSPIPDDATEYGSVIVEYSPTSGRDIRPAWITGSHTANVAGGRWSYGTNWKVVYSNFYHPSRCHGSSAQTYNGLVTARSARTAAGHWSYAQVRRSTNTNEAFYWFC
ncbi:lactococcin 972 family bacteriocin [Actinomyces bowdenii]|uniref:lactococcin 972 family bacteriocin n=1 Tax=Actinomyces bowdenii TaxID=131109 RepID=UPI0035A3056B